jgi:cold shock protein
MIEGEVLWFDDIKGFGFIQPDDGSRSVFVHISAAQRAGLGTLYQGQRIEYEVVADHRSHKPQAENLKEL